MALDLFHARRAEFDRVLAAPEGLDRTRAFSALARLNTLYMIKKAGSGHIGTSFSSLELVSWIHLHGLRRHADPAKGFRDIYFSSKGHDAPALYSVLIGLGLLDESLLHRLRRLGGLPGHPDVGTPHILANTGSLGMGLSKARGMLHASRLQGRDDRAFVLTGDGELQEGQFWESLQPTVNHQVRDVTVVIDHNKIQSDTWVKRVSDLGDLEKKLAAYDWRVSRIDGHDLAAIDGALGADSDGRPHVIIADTVKGHGVSFMEAFGEDDWFYGYHSGAPSDEDYGRGVEELIAQVNTAFATLGLGEVALERVAHESPKPPTGRLHQLVGAYGKALVEAARKDERVVALDADLMLDTGLTEFAKTFPDRFIECGIAEMDMVSQAGGLALRGMIPTVHSFACFLSTRPNEQIYTNATEHTKVVYAGSLAGLVPGGPGHSHQCVRDIASLGGMPNLVLVEPAVEEQLPAVVEHCLHGTDDSSYIRMTSIPCEIPFEHPGTLTPFQGTRIREGGDLLVIGYGPVLLAQAWRAAEAVARDGIAVQIVELPWLNRVDEGWLEDTVAAFTDVVTLDNHYRAGGQGGMLGASIAALAGHRPRVHRIGVTEVPRCGTNDEVLRHHRLDAAALADTFRNIGHR